MDKNEELLLPPEELEEELELTEEALLPEAALPEEHALQELIEQPEAVPETVQNGQAALIKGSAGWQKTKRVLARTDNVIGIIINVLYKLRKVFMAAPVLYYAVKLARYNNEHLPSVVGVNLQPNGVFSELLSRELAVMGPLAVTVVCLVLMFLSRKSMYAWAISIFTLVLPIVLLLSNRYPA